MTTVPSPPVSARQGLLSRHPLTSYFVITFAFSWLAFLSGVLTYYGVLSVAPSVIGVLGIVGLLGPVLSGFAMTALTEGGAGVDDLLRRIILWRVGVQWYLFVLVGLPAVMVLGTLLRPGALASFATSPLSRFRWPTCSPSSPWSSSGDRCSRSLDGPASRSPACSGCMDLWSVASCWAASGRCGTCQGS